MGICYACGQKKEDEEIVQQPPPNRVELTLVQHFGFRLRTVVILAFVICWPLYGGLADDGLLKHRALALLARIALIIYAMISLTQRIEDKHGHLLYWKRSDPYEKSHLLDSE